MNTIKGELDFSGVEATALLTLYAKAIESQSKDPVLKDIKAEEMIRQLDPLIKNQTGRMAQQLYGRSIDPRLTIHIPLRAKKYDSYATRFLASHPGGVIVNIGCGMDPRFYRIDNGQMHFFDVDLPLMISFKKQLLEENDRYRMIGQTVLDLSWMDQVEVIQQPVMFLAEGVFMYLPEAEVKRLVLAMQRGFPDSELVCELTNRTWVDGFWGKIAAYKMKQRVKMGEDAAFKFGVSGAEELETWSDGIKLLDKWFYMDDNHPKLGWIRIFRKWKFFRNAQFTAHYQLNVT
jgi:methyltransferase (TIGR00027 family)